MTGGNEAGGRWFYVQEGRRKGPLGVAELVALILEGEVPEDTLVWRTGLGEWVAANSVEEIRRELPPPIPGKGDHRPDQIDAVARAEAPAEDADDGGSGGTNPADGSPRPGGHRRHRHRTRYRLATGRRRWLVPLVVMLIVVVAVLWYLLRRFNEVPPGQVILQSAVSEQARPAGAPEGPGRLGA